MSILFLLINPLINNPETGLSSKIPINFERNGFINNFKNNLPGKVLYKNLNVKFSFEDTSIASKLFEYRVSFLQRK